MSLHKSHRGNRFVRKREFIIVFTCFIKKKLDNARIEKSAADDNKTRPTQVSPF
jgi:hypothetical protein